MSNDENQEGRSQGKDAKGRHGRSVWKDVDMRRETCVGYFRLIIKFGRPCVASERDGGTGGSDMRQSDPGSVQGLPEWTPDVLGLR
jgi:hypothetical protein